MQRNFVEVTDVLESIKKFGKEDILTWNPSVFNDNKTKNKKATFDCTWVPVAFKYANGTMADVLKLKFRNVLTGSGAKNPSTVDTEKNEKIKNLNIAFRKVDLEEIETGDYAPKVKETPEEQEKENEKAHKRALELKKNTDEFNDAMEALDLSYKKLCNEMAESKSLGFTLRKDRKMKKTEDLQTFNSEVQIFSVRQTSREDTESKEEVILTYPFTRVKLMAGKDVDTIGISKYNKDTHVWEFMPNVFDSKKSTKKNDYAPVLAKVKVGSKLQILDVKTAPIFITYKSIVGGIIEFKDIVSSKFGLSFGNRFLELYVARHKSGGSEPAFSKEDLKQFYTSRDEDEDEDDSDVEFKEAGDDEVKPSTKSGKALKVQTKKSKKEPEPEPDDDDDNTDLEDYEEPEEADELEEVEEEEAE